MLFLLLTTLDSLRHCDIGPLNSLFCEKLGYDTSDEAKTGREKKFKDSKSMTCCNGKKTNFGKFKASTIECEES